MKKFLFIFLAIVYFLIFISTFMKHENELHVYIWPDYIKRELIEKFEKENNCEVVFDSFDSNESMYAKLQLGATGYDIIFPSGYMLELMQNQQMLKEIDKSKIANLKNIESKFLPLQGDPLFGVPFAITYTGVAYRQDKVSIDDKSWGIFADSKLKGRMTLLNDMREAIGAGLKYLGYSVNTTNVDEINKAADLIISWKKNLAKFESEQNKHGLSSAEYLVVQGYNGDMLQVMRENKNVDFFLPKEGSIMSVDYAVIMQNAPNQPLAEKFINFLLDAENARDNIEFTLFSSPNKAAFALLPADLQDNRALFPTDEMVNKSEMIKFIGKTQELYSKAWDRIKKE